MKRRILIILIPLFALLATASYYAYQLDMIPSPHVLKFVFIEPESRKDFDFDKDGYLSGQELKLFVQFFYKKLGDGTLKPWSKDVYLKRSVEKIKTRTTDEKRIAAEQVSATKTFEKIDSDINDVIDFSEFFIYMKRTYQRHERISFSDPKLPVL